MAAQQNTERAMINARRFSLLALCATLAGVVAFTKPRHPNEPGGAFVTKIPSGYRDWRLVSVAREEGRFDDIRAILGNEKETRRPRRTTRRSANRSPL